MGRAARWLWNLVGGGSKVKKKEQDYCSSYGGQELAEKKRWSFWKSRESGATDVSLPPLGGNAPTAPAIEAAWFKSFHSVSEREQSNHSIAVAEATAVAAEAAVVAVQAAAVAVRISVRQRGSGVERWAAVKIQSAFRGYLARKARRALKSLVKLQALIRGYLVREQAASALHRMQSLLRAQATMRAHRARNLLLKDETFRLEVRPRRSFERYTDTKSEQLHAIQSQRYFERSSPKIIEIDTCRSKTRAPSSPIPTQISFPDRRHFPENDDWWIAGGVKCRAPATSRCVRGSSRSGAATPARSLSGACSPNYMANTHSFKAKSRSSSSSQTKHSADARRRQPLDELNGGRLHFLAQDALNSKRAVFGKDAESEVYLRRVW